MVTGLGLLPPGAPADWDEVDYVGYVDGQAQFDPAVYGSPAGLERLVDAPGAIAAIRCPILLLTADPMPCVDVDPAEHVFTGHWTHGRHVHVAGSGHAIHYNQFDRFVALLTGFLRQHA